MPNRVLCETALKVKCVFNNMHLMLYCIYVRSPDHNLLFILGDHVYLDNYMYIGHVVYMDFVSLDSIKKYFDRPNKIIRSINNLMTCFK